jgi:hypothetical protein
MIAPVSDLVQLLLAGAGFAAVVLLVARSALAGACVVLVSFLLFEATSPPVGENVVFPLGSISVYPLDVATLALFAVGVWRLFSEDVYGPAKIALLALAVGVVAHLAWGVVDFGLEQASNYARLWFGIVSGIVYGATVKNWDRRLPAAIIATGGLLAVLSIFGILRHGLYAANTFIDEGGEAVDARPVIAMGVLVMLEGLILLLARGGSLTLPKAGIAILLVTGIVLLQYRTLWVVAIVCAALGLFYLAVRYMASEQSLVYTVTALVLILMPVSLFAVGRVGTYQKSFESATAESSTLTWRIDAWRILVARHSSPLDLIVGTPTGTSREITVHGRTTNLSAHNMYVEVFLLNGLVGIVALVGLVALALGVRRQTAHQLDVPAPAILILIVCIGLVAMTHTPDQVQGLLFGSLVAAACFQTQPSVAGRRVTARRQQELAAAR